MVVYVELQVELKGIVWSLGSHLFAILQKLLPSGVGSYGYVCTVRIPSP